jgi:hypothetical protein
VNSIAATASGADTARQKAAGPPSAERASTAASGSRTTSER